MQKILECRKFSDSAGNKILAHFLIGDYTWVHIIRTWSYAMYVNTKIVVVNLVIWCWVWDP